MGSIIGVGIFNLPTSLSFYGPITLVSMGLTTVGAIALALLFAALSRRLPADGGPYAYSRVAFGNKLGFANAWSYWITAWAGNAAIAVGWVLYVEVFVNKGHNRLFSVLLVLVGLWLPAAINLSGVKNMGSVQVVTTILKFVALAFMSTVGLFYISKANFTPWNVSGGSALGAIGGGMAIALFSYLGVEVAAVAAAKVRDPDRNIPKSTVFGTLLSAAVYMLSLHRGVWHPLEHAAAGFDRPLQRRRELDVRRHLLGERDGRRRHHLRVRCAQRLDHDLRGDAAGRREGRALPEAVRARVGQEGPGVRDHRFDCTRLDRDGHQLHRLQRCDRIHDPRADDRDHGGDPLRVLGARADQVAAGRQAAAPGSTLRP